VSAMAVGTVDVRDFVAAPRQLTAERRQKRMTGGVGDDGFGIVSIILQTHPEGATPFNFTATNGIAKFTLVDNGTPANTRTWSKPAGIYTFRVANPAKWALISLTCDSQQLTLKAHRLVQITLHSDEHVTCTFTESYRIPDAMIALLSGGPYSGNNF
jgi:hypothetical protein